MPYSSKLAGVNFAELLPSAKALSANFVQHGRVENVGGASAKVLFVKFLILVYGIHQYDDCKEKLYLQCQGILCTLTCSTTREPWQSGERESEGGEERAR